jgi:diguanylate cyclase
MARRARSAPDVTLSVFVIDIRRMAAINELHGTATGDRAIAGVAQHLGALEAPDAVVARLGGDEFAVGTLGEPGTVPLVFPRTLIVPVDEGAQGVASIDVALRWGDASSPVAASQPGENTVEDLLVEATARLRSLRSAEQRSPAGSTAPLGERRELTLDLRKGVREAGVSAWFQPIADPTGTTIVGWEALARWQRVDRLLAPDEFLPPSHRCDGLP